MDAVAAGPAADRDDPVARLDLLVGHAAGQDADCAAEHQRIGQVARVDGQRAVDRGDPHAVAVVADAGDDPLRARAGGGARRRERRPERSSGGATQKTSVLQIGLAPSPVPRASRITPPKPGVGAAVGIDRRGMVVGLDLEADVVLVVKPDHAGVVAEDADQPVAVELVGRAKDRLLEQVVDRFALERRSARAASCASSARSRSGRASRARSRSGRGRARRNGAGSPSSRPGRARAVPTGSGARARRRRAIAIGTSMRWNR